MLGAGRITMWIPMVTERPTVGAHVCGRTLVPFDLSIVCREPGIYQVQRLFLGLREAGETCRKCRGTPYRERRAPRAA